ncbi:hypothetical protein D6J78_12745 [Salmonella enterica subsp. enterica serovar Abaetetuba]|nr:hypothetical protein [Salmonella enterica]EBS0892532.1 hypothetical protein [Salmonella enterica subsp. enterica serovar Abaetetuba]ECE0472917.1 hypothetical protein [Salmonella enterica subsp. enterica serovar Glostrup]ECH8208608.1 hypothetical protein [Salmonella enterica subsp. enterica]EAX7074417.1 hypothetical protein [Salmonella enterica]
MSWYQKKMSARGAGLVISVLTLPFMANASQDAVVNARFAAYETADFTAEYIPVPATITTDRLMQHTPLGTVRTTQPSWARNRDIKFEDSTGKRGVLTFTHAEGKQSIDVIILPSSGPTINGQEGGAEVIGKTSETWILLTRMEYKQIPAGSYSDTITVSYDAM